ncbi:MAG: class I SAM-dependent methyltransferase, partial [Anaerolineales bacterium]|nr:class I SAM-dependent methyltransferase [Anaerolineales bacterium]
MNRDTVPEFKSESSTKQPAAPANVYDAFYFATSCGAPYERSQHWLTFFSIIAEHIVRELHPASVLDAGCAMGFLVESLRDRGVEAFGIDASAYAIERVREDMRSFCAVESVTTPLTRRYDLIVCIEVLEHLTPAEAEQAIANFCAHS